MAEGPTDQPHAESTSFAAFDHLLETYRRTHAALHAVVHDQERDDAALRDVLAREALHHVEAVLEGLILLARTGQFSGGELRELVRRAGIVAPASPGSAEARAAAEESRQPRPPLRAVDGRTMLAAGHARVVFSVIPSLPPEAVSWPSPRRTYADIAAPHSAGELLARAEELTRVVWRVASGDERRDEPLRRTLAFYDAGARLSVRGFLAA
jgi:hypothetical protein